MTFSWHLGDFYTGEMSEGFEDVRENFPGVIFHGKMSGRINVGDSCPGCVSRSFRAELQVSTRSGHDLGPMVNTQTYRDSS